jgi:hypothetical protein
MALIVFESWGAYIQQYAAISLFFFNFLVSLAVTLILKDLEPEIHRANMLTKPAEPQESYEPTSFCGAVKVFMRLNLENIILGLPTNIVMNVYPMLRGLFVLAVWDHRGMQYVVSKKALISGKNSAADLRSPTAQDLPVEDFCSTSAAA